VSHYAKQKQAESLEPHKALSQLLPGTTAHRETGARHAYIAGSPVCEHVVCKMPQVTDANSPCREMRCAGKFRIDWQHPGRISVGEASRPIAIDMAEGPAMAILRRASPYQVAANVQGIHSAREHSSECSRKLNTDRRRKPTHRTTADNDSRQ
jgi:hypothetical protein